MSIKQLIDKGLQYLTNRRQEMKPKNVSRQRKDSAGSATPVCGACGNEIVEVNKITHRRVCFKCGKEAK